MQSTEAKSKMRLDISALILLLDELATRGDSYSLDGGFLVDHEDAVAVRQAATTLAAERDRADRAEARLARVREEASALRNAPKGDIAHVAGVGVLFLALLDAEATA